MNVVVPFNRTILELKLRRLYRAADGRKAFNRTILELKLSVPYSMFFSDIAFNRTILELKHKISIGNLNKILLLIVPFWN